MIDFEIPEETSKSGNCLEASKNERCRFSRHRKRRKYYFLSYRMTRRRKRKFREIEEENDTDNSYSSGSDSPLLRPTKRRRTNKVFQISIIVKIQVVF